jgi:hypothetical protein
MDCGLISMKLRGQSAKLPWVDSYLAFLTWVRSNLTHWIGILQLGAADSAGVAVLSAGGKEMRRWFAGVT